MIFKNIVITFLIVGSSVVFAGESKPAESSSGSPSMLLHSLKMPDITLINHLAYKMVKVDKNEAIKELNYFLVNQYSVTAKDLKIQNNFARQSHSEVAALIKNGNIIAAYGIISEVIKMPNASHEKVITLDYQFIKNAISASNDNDDTDQGLALARTSIKKIGEPERRDWHTYIYWAVMGRVFNDDIAFQAGIQGLEETGAKTYLVSLKKEISAIDKIMMSKKNTAKTSKEGDD